MAKSTATANSLLALIYNATNWQYVADNTATTPATYLEVALHTAAVGPGVPQNTSEGGYSNYARVQVNRATGAGGWLAPSNGAVKNTSLIQFLECNGGTATIEWVSVGISGVILHAGALAAPRTISNGIQPQFAAEALIITET
jgi:hypothetical protein